MYVVKVDENSHYMDEESRWTLGEFDNYEDAEAACRKMVDDNLAEGFVPGMSARSLINYYRMWGDDPFIVAQVETPRQFSAWDYAKKRAAEMCGDPKSSI